MAPWTAMIVFRRAGNLRRPIIDLRWPIYSGVRRPLTPRIPIISADIVAVRVSVSHTYTIRKWLIKRRVSAARCNRYFENRDKVCRPITPSRNISRDWSRKVFEIWWGRFFKVQFLRWNIYIYRIVFYLDSTRIIIRSKQFKVHTLCILCALLKFLLDFIRIE